MQLKIFFHLDQPLDIPINYNHILQGIIYTAIHRVDRDYANNIHSTGIHNDDLFTANFKLFSFSKLIGKYKVSDKKIIFYDSVFWEIRSIDPNFIFTLYQAFSKYGIQFGNKNIKFRMETRKQSNYI